MAVVTTGPGAINMSTLAPGLIGPAAAFGTVTSITPNQIEFSYPGFHPMKLVIQGSGFTPGSGRLPTGGTIKLVTLTDLTTMDFITYGSDGAPLGIAFDSFLTSLQWNTTGFVGAKTLPPNIEELIAGGADAINGTASGDIIFGLGGDDILLGLAGNDTIRGDAGNDRIDGGVGGFDTADYLSSSAAVSVSLLLQGVQQDTLGAGVDILTGFENLTGTTLSDVLTGDGGANRLDGHLGDDVLIGRGGSDTLVGGAGVDIAVYMGVRRSAAISRQNSAYVVADGVDGGTSVVQQVERLKFIDGFVGIDAIDTPAVVYRLYVAALGRTADSAGLSSWVKAIDSRSADIRTVANGFIFSDEFLARYGSSTSDSQFIGLLYRNVLDRSPDLDGLNNWLGALAGGRTRAEVLIGFSDSQENIAKTDSALQKGIWVGDPNAGIAARFYDTVFGRLPDASGLDTWTKALNGGASLNTVANGFVASTEFQTTYGSLNNNQFVELMYQNVLHRPSDSGRQTWLDLLNNGGSRAQVVVGFSESPEHIKLLAPHIDDGVWTA